jgi:hypothetical protein
LDDGRFAIGWQIDIRKISQRIFADEKWYLERPEQEEQITGVLATVTPPSGPAGRPALSFALERIEGCDLQVYAAGIENVLCALVGRQISIRGKVIDFHQAGFAIELWIGEIETLPTEG